MATSLLELAGSRVVCFLLRARRLPPPPCSEVSRHPPYGASAVLSRRGPGAPGYVNFIRPRDDGPTWPHLALVEVIDEIRVPRIGPGRPRTRPDVVIADKAYSNGVIRSLLASRGIKTVIPQKSNDQASRKHKGTRGGRPPAFDAQAYRGRNVVERTFGLAKQWRGIATRYDKLAITYRATAVLGAVITWLRN